MAAVSKKVRARHLMFLQANLAMLSAMTYQGFLDHGRGMLMLDDSDFVDKPPGVLTTFRAVYVAAGSAELLAMGGKWPGEKEAGWVETYDPRTTALFGFIRKDVGSSSYNLTGPVDGTPEVLHGRVRPGRN